MRGSVRGVERAIAAWQGRPQEARPVILMDFDGTLVEFDVNPTAARLVESRQALLQLLGTRIDLSGGIVSGRRVSDLRTRVAAGPSLFYAGLHGLEIEGPGLHFTHNAIAAAAPTIGVLVKELRQATATLPGIVIEDKGFAVVLHVRGVSKADRLHAITRFRALSEPYLKDGTLRMQPGAEIFELLPNVDWAKGDALRCILRHLETEYKQMAWPVYIGDDATDEDAFDEIGESGLTIAVSNRTAGASFSIPDPAGVETFLRAILSTE
jgi:alpha,alpha-trehalase